MRLRRRVIPEIVQMVSAVRYLGARNALLRTQTVSVNLASVRTILVITIIHG